MAHSMEEIAELLRQTKFRHRLIGGVDEDDVWKRLKQLQNEYAELIEAERQQNIGAISQWEKAVSSLQNAVAERDGMIEKLRNELNKDRTDTYC